MGSRPPLTPSTWTGRAPRFTDVIVLLAMYSAPFARLPCSWMTRTTVVEALAIVLLDELPVWRKHNMRITQMTWGTAMHRPHAPSGTPPNPSVRSVSRQTQAFCKLLAARKAQAELSMCLFLRHHIALDVTPANALAIVAGTEEDHGRPEPLPDADGRDLERGFTRSHAQSLRPDDATSGDASSFDDNHERRLGMRPRHAAGGQQQAAGSRKKYTCPVKLENINYAGSLRRGRFPTVDPKVGPRSSRYASRPRAQEDRRFQPLYVTRVPWPSSCAMLSLSPLCSALAHAECTRSCPSQTNVHSPV